MSIDTFLFLMQRRPPGPTRTATRVPYTTLVRALDDRSLPRAAGPAAAEGAEPGRIPARRPRGRPPVNAQPDAERARVGSAIRDRTPCRHAGPRSEEHPSELQSLMRTSSAVFSLKKKHKNDINSARNL